MQPPPICVTRRIRIVSKVSNKPHSKPGPTITSKPSPNKHNRFLEPAPPSKSDPSTIRPTRVGSPEPPHTFLEPSTFKLGVMEPWRHFTWQDSSSPHRPCKLKSMHPSTSSVGSCRRPSNTRSDGSCASHASSRNPSSSTSLVGSCQRPSNTWSDGSSVQDYQILRQGLALVRRGSCKVTARSSEQAMMRFPQQSPAGVLSIVQTIHAPHTHSSTYNITGEWLRKQTIRLQVAHNGVPSECSRQCLKALGTTSGTRGRNMSCSR